MRKWVILSLVLFMSRCGVTPPPGNGSSSEYLIIDHSAVDQYAQIPDVYIQKIKTMWLGIAGESHSMGYRIGGALLTNLDSRFAVIVQEDDYNPSNYITNALRVNRAVRTIYGSWSYGYGEANCYTSPDAISNTLFHLAFVGTNNFGPYVFGFGWCWDMSWQNDPDGGTNTTWGVRWAGSSEGGPDGSLRWGLDDSDFSLTGNHVSLQNYLKAIDVYRDFCAAQGYDITVVFTTGPVDRWNDDETMYQAFIKQQAIQDYVRIQKGGRILFDYADILSWSDGGQQYTLDWINFNNQLVSYQQIHPSNTTNRDGSGTEDGDHIGEVGTIRLAKAYWVMLARIAGWVPE